MNDDRHEAMYQVPVSRLIELSEPACRWAAYPSDDDVEAAARAMSRSFGYRESAWRRWAVVARAALLAVKTLSEKDTP